MRIAKIYFSCDIELDVVTNLRFFTSLLSSSTLVHQLRAPARDEKVAGSSMLESGIFVLGKCI